MTIWGGDCRADPLEGLKYISQLAWECLVIAKEQQQKTFGASLLVLLTQPDLNKQLENGWMDGCD